MQRVRRRARHRPGGELRLLQRRRGRPVPADRRPAARPQPRPGAGRRPRGTTRGRSPGSARAAAAGSRDLARTAAGHRRDARAASPPGAALGALSGSRREAVDLGIALGGELGSVLAGVRLDVQGAEHLADPAGRLPVQPPEPARRARPGQAAARRLHRRGQEGAGQHARASGWCSGSPTSRSSTGATTTRPGQGPRAGGAEAARRHLAGDRAGGHPVGDPDARAVQEGRLPRRDAGRGADRPDRHPQRRRADVARRDDDPVGHRAGRASCRRSPPTAGRSRTSTSRWTRSAGSTWTTLANWSGLRPTGGGDRGERRGRTRRAPGRRRWTGAPPRR